MEEILRDNADTIMFAVILMAMLPFFMAMNAKAHARHKAERDAKRRARRMARKDKSIPPEANTSTKYDPDIRRGMWGHYALRAGEGGGPYSFIGGMPIAPKGFSVPMAGPGRPTALLAQIDFGTLPPSPQTRLLPERGVLYLFAPLEDWHQWDAMEHDLAVFVPDAPSADWCETGPVLPPSEKIPIEAGWIRHDGEAELDCLVTRDENMPLGGLRSQLRAFHGKADHCGLPTSEGHFNGIDQHQILGAAVNVQGNVDMFDKTHLMLLQLVGHGLGDLQIGDGAAQIWITPDDLAARCFDRMTVLQDNT